MMLALLKFDLYTSALLKILIPHNNFFDLLFSFFSLKGNSILIWAIIIVVAIILEEKKNPGLSKHDKKFIFLFFISFLTTALLTTYVLKGVFRRPRPAFRTNYSQFKIKPVITSACPVDFSFPSGHAATAFAAATVLTAFNKKRKWLFYLTAVLISYSRIYLGCHYFLDILAGSILGYLLSKIILQIDLTKWLSFLVRKK